MAKTEFDGYLTQQELENLRKNNFSDKEIRFIKDFVYNNRKHLTGFVDLIGDRECPSRQFLYNIKHYGYLLDDDPKKVISKKDVFLRKIINDKLIKLVGPSQLKNKQVFENRKFLKSDSCDIDEVEKDDKIILPNSPVIWTPNHHFKDDVLASYLATSRQAYILFGSIPQFYNTIDGVLANLVGSLMTNRKVGSSKKASIDKAIRACELGSDILCFPEGVWNKYSNRLLLDFWPGIYRIAKETGAQVVPIAHYIYDPTLKMNKKLNLIHTVVDDPIDISSFSEKEGLEYLRDTIGTWYYLMMEKYGKTTRDELLNSYKKDNQQEISSHQAYEQYMNDLLETVDWYDSEIELSYDYRPKDIIRQEDVFKSIANVKNISARNIKDVDNAKKIVKIKKNEDYQRRY